MLLAASLFFLHPLPLEMPKAQAYLVKEEGRMMLEDRYDTLDLWTSQAVVGRWEDDDGRQFMVSRLSVLPPKFAEGMKTRREYRKGAVCIDRKRDLGARDEAIARLLPFDLPDEFSAPRQEIRNFKEILYLHGTNETAVAAAFLPDRPLAPWYLAVWELLPGDDFSVAIDAFENSFLARWDEVVRRDLRSEIGLNDPRAERDSPGRRPEIPSERELLREDARNSITNYLQWRATDSSEFVVLDDLPREVKFVEALTNELPVLRAKYAAALPTAIDGSNVLAIARIFRDRDEYIEAVGEELGWSAACWCPLRRELVAYYPEGGSRDLMKTIRHEAFHQYLSYAASMIPVSPWLNEGYAEYFEDENSADWRLDGTIADIEAMAASIPALMEMDYAQFYAGTDSERAGKYRLARSIAHFLEHGAGEVRFDPFKNVKKLYFEALFKTHDMRQATENAFENQEKARLFVSEWKKYWLSR